MVVNNKNRTSNEMFEIFANLHPVEAFDLDNKRFCKFYREKIESLMTDEEIKDFVNNNRD